MSNQVDRRTLERWLLAHGFVLLPGKATGHRQYVRDGIKITVPGHGPHDLTKKHVALILRALARAGFDKNQVREEARHVTARLLLGHGFDPSACARISSMPPVK